MSFSLGNALTIAGMAAGGLSGGGFAGAAAGGALGGMVGGIIDPQELKVPKPQQIKAKTAVDVGASSSMNRRLQALQESPLGQVTAGLDSLKYIKDDQLRANLAKPLLQAEYLARNKMEA